MPGRSRPSNSIRTFIPEPILEPELGRWTLRVIPFLVENWDFRLRVTLEEQVEGTANPVRPNLQAYPPYEFGFVAPANPAAGSAVDKQNPAGPPDISCTADERIEAVEHDQTPPQRCLRFSAAMYNVGRGSVGPAAARGQPLGRAGDPARPQGQRSGTRTARGRGMDLPRPTWSFALRRLHRL